MSIYLIATKEDLINLRKLAEQQKNQRAFKFKNGITKQTHDIKLAESLSPVTKKLDELKKTNQKLGEDITESTSEDDVIRAPANSSNLGNSVREMLGSLMNSHNSLKMTQDEIVQANILGVPLQISGGDRIRINENVYDLTTEIYKAISSTSYTGKTMKDESDIWMMNNIIRDLGYKSLGDRRSNRKTICTITLPKVVDEIQNKTSDEITEESADLQGERVKTIIPSNIIDIYTRLEILPGLNLSGHSDTFAEAKNLIIELYKRGEIQNTQQNRNALDKLHKKN